MTMATKNEIFKSFLAEYLKASKPRKGEILDNVCGVTRMNRKAAVRKFGNLQTRDSCSEEGRGREVFYTPDVTAALKEIWGILDKVCGELLHPQIKDNVEILIKLKKWQYENETTDKLLCMSQATVKRKAGEFAKKEGLKRKGGFGTTKPSLMKTIVPIFKGPWDGKPAGYGQIDTVVHCGETLHGDYAYTCNNADVETLWDVPRAQWNKGAENTRNSLEYIRSKAPFPMLGAHSDTGNEFINKIVVGWCEENGIEPSRSRPYKKNDNMHVEERNGHIVRKHVGYQRLDCLESVDALNELYDVLAVYLNHFIPSRRCLSKTRVGSKYVRKYEKIAKTPYQRVLESKTIADEAKEKLRAEHETLDPVFLRDEVECLKKKLYDTQRRYGKS